MGGPEIRNRKIPMLTLWRLRSPGQHIAAARLWLNWTSKLLHFISFRQRNGTAMPDFLDVVPDKLVLQPGGLTIGKLRVL